LAQIGRACLARDNLGGATEPGTPFDLTAPLCGDRAKAMFQPIKQEFRSSTFSSMRRRARATPPRARGGRMRSPWDLGILGLTRVNESLQCATNRSVLRANVVSTLPRNQIDLGATVAVLSGGERSFARRGRNAEGPLPVSLPSRDVASTSCDRSPAGAEPSGRLRNGRSWRDATCGLQRPMGLESLLRTRGDRRASVPRAGGGLRPQTVAPTTEWSACRAVHRCRAGMAEQCR
jgi:hypothetical protein